MPKRVTMRELTDALLRIGFETPEIRGKHVLFRHPGTGTLVVLPKLRPSTAVGRARLAAVRLSVIGREVATFDEFDDALQAVHA